MNIFVLHTNTKLAAQMHCDKHVVKMITETAQLLSTTISLCGGTGPYKVTHKNHPCARWARECTENWEWLKLLGLELYDEYKFRYDNKTHKAGEIITQMEAPHLKANGEKTPFVQCMPDEFKHSSPVVAYRQYYLGAKKDLLNYKLRGAPQWVTTGNVYV